MKNTIRKILCTLLVVVMVLSSAPLNGFVGMKFPEINLPKLFDFSIEAEAATSGIYTYTVSNGKATITDCDTTASGSIVIPSTLGGYPVTKIGESAFRDCEGLISITMSDSIISIGKYAFYDCASIASVTIGNSVTIIDDGAFIGCIKLTSVTIPDSVKSIGGWAFAECSSLTSVTIPRNVTNVDGYTFSGCDSLTRITIPDNVTSIGEWAFSNCFSLISIIIPDSVKSIGEWAFYGCNSLSDVHYSGSKDAWKKISIGSNNESLLKANIHFGYSLGVDTYSFANFGDKHGDGHCFGMSVTSSGYYLGVLEPNFKISNNNTLYDQFKSSSIIEPICHYHAIQGSIRDQAIVAGSTDGEKINTDWDEVINYVKNHKYDGKGNLVIGYGKTDKGGHAVNFLRYEVVDGQERIYAYDNNCPTKETYFYQDNNGDVRQAVHETFSGAIDSFFALVNVTSYLNYVSSQGKEYKRKAIYAYDPIRVDGATRYKMFGDINSGNHYVYELPDDVTTVKITPLTDNATFTYMDKEYSFNEINEKTYAELTLATTEEDAPEFEIINNSDIINSVSIDNVTMNYKTSTTVKPEIEVVEGADYTVTYSSSNPDIATVDENGKVTAKGRGEAEIIVTVTDEYGNKVTDTCKVEVKYTWWQWIIVIVLFGWIWY